MNTRKAPINLGPGLTPREAAVDSMYRLVHGLDFNDADLVRSAFVEDAIFDMSGLSPATGQSHAEQKGVENIINGVLSHVGPMPTSHNLSNVRVKLNDTMDQAEVMTHVIAQHFRPGEGYDATKRDYALFGSTYWADVVKVVEGDNALWKMKRFEIQVLWAEGDMSVTDVKTWKTS